MHMDMIPVIEEQTEPVIKWFLKIGCKRYLLGHFFSDIVLTCDLFRRRRNFIKTQREALPVVQGFGRCVLARLERLLFKELLSLTSRSPTALLS
jgi:hypothetical protein